MPFCGTLACAPEREVFTSLLGQGPFGGNIDCRDVRAGHTILLNAYHEGGLLYVGDMHGGQGDTEFTGIADETRATIQLSATVDQGEATRPACASRSRTAWWRWGSTCRWSTRSTTPATT